MMDFSLKHSAHQYFGKLLLAGIGFLAIIACWLSRQDSFAWFSSGVALVLPMAWIGRSSMRPSLAAAAKIVWTGLWCATFMAKEGLDPAFAAAPIGDSYLVAGALFCLIATSAPRAWQQWRALPGAQDCEDDLGAQQRAGRLPQWARAFVLSLFWATGLGLICAQMAPTLYGWPSVTAARYALDEIYAFPKRSGSELRDVSEIRVQLVGVAGGAAEKTALLRVESPDFSRNGAASEAGHLSQPLERPATPVRTSVQNRCLTLERAGLFGWRISNVEGESVRPLKCGATEAANSPIGGRPSGVLLPPALIDMIIKLLNLVCAICLVLAPLATGEPGHPRKAGLTLSIMAFTTAAGSTALLWVLLL